MTCQTDVTDFTIFDFETGGVMFEQPTRTSAMMLSSRPHHPGLVARRPRSPDKVEATDAMFDDGRTVSSFQCFVRTADGTTLTLRVCRTDRVRLIKKMVSAKTGAPPETVRLIYGGRQLEDAHDVRFQPPLKI